MRSLPSPQFILLGRHKALLIITGCLGLFVPARVATFQMDIETLASHSPHTCLTLASLMTRFAPVLALAAASLHRISQLRARQEHTVCTSLPCLCISRARYRHEFDPASRLAVIRCAIRFCSPSCAARPSSVQRLLDRGTAPPVPLASSAGLRRYCRQSTARLAAIRQAAPSRAPSVQLARRALTPPQRFRCELVAIAVL